MNKIPLITFLTLIFSFIISKNYAQDITSGLVAYYQLEETSSDLVDPVYDDTGLHDGQTWGTDHGYLGIINNAHNFDGSGRIEIIDESDITDYTEFTLSAWIKPSSLGTDNTIIAKVSPYRDFVLSISNSKIRAHILSVGYQECFGTSTIPTDVWSHVLCTWKNNTWKVYYNGNLENTCQFSRGPTWLCNDLRIGSLTGGQEMFFGIIDEVRIYNRALSDVDVTALYNITGGSAPALSVNDITVNEDDGNATFTIELTQTISEIVSVEYETSDGNATVGEDYTSTSGLINIPANTQSVTVSVPIIDDSASDFNEDFNFTLSNPSSNAVIGDATATCTIIDDETSGFSCSNLITSYPYSEGIEYASTNTWENSTDDDIEWIRETGGTPSGSTGPSSAQEGVYYYFVEASYSNNPYKTAILNGPCFDLMGQSAAEFSFYYHMYGYYMGTLTLEASIDGTNWNSLWSLSGNQGDSWEQETVSLNAYVGNVVQLRFYGLTGNGYASDMAIDNLTLVTEEEEISFWAENGNHIYSTNTGNVGIGTTSPDEKLTVNGTIHSKEVIVDLDFPAPDYVFKEQYELRAITDLKDYLEENNHLPGFPSAKKIAKNGINLSKINMSLLKHLEELTLYIIQDEERIQKIERQNNLNAKE